MSVESDRPPARTEYEAHADRAPDDVRVTEERLRLALAASDVGTWDYHPAEDASVLDARSCAILGIPAGSTLSRADFLAHVHADDRPTVAAALAAALDPRCPAPYVIRYRVLRPDGAPCWIEARGRALIRERDGAPWIARFTGILSDVTARHDEEVAHARALAEQTAERRLLETVYAQLPAGIVTVEVPSGRIVQRNAEAERLLGHAVHPIADPDGFPRVRALGRDGGPLATDEHPTFRAMRGETVHQHRMRYRRGDGSVIVLSVSAAPVRDATGRVTHAVSTFVDVTERDAIAAALAEGEERLRAALDASNTGTFRWEIRTNALVWDDSLDRLFGLEPGQTARSLDEFLSHVHPDDRQRVIDACQRCAVEGVDFDEEFRVVWPDGSLHFLADRGKTFRDADGRPAYMTGACVDVTERRALAAAQAETVALAQALQAATARLSSAATLADVLRVAVEAGRAALDASAASLALLQDDGATLELVAADGDAPAAVLDAWRTFPLDADVPMATAARTGTPAIHETREAILAGAPTLADAVERGGVGAGAAFPLTVGGRPFGALGVTFARAERFTAERRRFAEQFAAQCAESIERARLYELARAAQAEAEQANRAKSAFLARMSHELRTPLNAIDGHAAIVAEGIHGPVTEAQRTAIGRVRRAGRHLLALVNDILDHARLETGRVEYRLADVPVRPTLEQVLEVVVPQARERGVTLAAPAVDPALLVRADPDRLRQIVVNLVGNAVKFTSAGGTVAVDAARVGDDVHLRVRDSGIGIAPDQLALIFEPFEQVESARRHSRDGVGLGLAISRELARGMGGDLTVASAPGEGSIFTVRLPGA